MDYPNDFDTPAFPAGKALAFSRTVAIWISIVFFLIIALCAFVVYTTRLKQNYPFLIAVNPITNEWDVVTYPGKNTKEIIYEHQIIQEKLVNNYVKNWFTISGNQSENEEKWKECTIADCDEPEQFSPNNTKCFMFCYSSEDLFTQFQKKILPEYRARVSQGTETWTVTDMRITPSENISESGSFWQVYFFVNSSVSGPIDVVAFVDIARNEDLYPATLGYYVKDFNAYKMSHPK